MIHSAQAWHAVRVKLPQYTDNTKKDEHEFLMAILPVIQLPRYQESVSSILKFYFNL